MFQKLLNSINWYLKNTDKKGNEMICYIFILLFYSVRVSLFCASQFIAEILKVFKYLF